MYACSIEGFVVCLNAGVFLGKAHKFNPPKSHITNTCNVHLH